MGFWDTVGKVAKSAMNELEAANERSKEYREEMLDKSDDELFYVVKRNRNSSPLKATAAFGELKKRGYDSEEIKSILKEL